MKELDFVLSKTKRGKVQDPEGIVRDILRSEGIGHNLKITLLVMLNIIKEKGIITKFMRKANMSANSKKGKSRLYLQNESGLFLVNIIRGIFMRILYNRKCYLNNLNM